MLKTNQLEICDGHFVVVSPESWDIVADSITLIEVSEDPPSFKHPLPVVSFWSKSTSQGYTSYSSLLLEFYGCRRPRQTDRELCLE